MRYSREILLALYEKPLRFTNLREKLGLSKLNFSKSTLSLRLQTLRAVNLVEAIPNQTNLSWEFGLTHTGKIITEQIDIFTKNIERLDTTRPV
ncbi:MAG: winged helix-turn-helix transcriptional regulator [Nitrososphaerales archaeon]